LSIETIDKQLKETEVSQRRKYLIQQLHNMEIYQTKDGRKLEEISLYTLEWTHIDAINESAKAYWENH
jgi:hypothetical protein